jgi:hypothetical protein
MTDHARVEDDAPRDRARAWQREQARKTLAEIRAGAPGHAEVSEQEFEAGWDQLISEAEQGDSPAR